MLKGKVVKFVRAMTEAELEAEGWTTIHDYQVVIVFTDGTKVYASADTEGNGPGALFGVTGEGRQVHIAPED